MEILRVSSNLFRVFAAVHRNFPEILLVTGAASAKSPNKSSDFFRVFAPDPIYSEILLVSTRKNSEYIKIFRQKLRKKPIILNLHVIVPPKIATLSPSKFPPAPRPQAISGPKSGPAPRGPVLTFSPNFSPKSLARRRFDNKKRDPQQRLNCYGSLIFMASQEGNAGTN